MPWNCQSFITLCILQVSFTLSTDNNFLSSVGLSSDFLILPSSWPPVSVFHIYSSSQSSFLFGSDTLLRPQIVSNINSFTMCLAVILTGIVLLFVQVFAFYSYRYCAVIRTGICLLFLQVLCCYSYRYCAIILIGIVLLFIQLLCCYSYSYCAVILTVIVLLFLQLWCCNSYRYFAVILTAIALLFLKLLCCYFYSYCAVILKVIVL